MPPYESRPANHYPFRGRTAIITGSCGDGIGRSTALLMGALGCNIALNYGTYRQDGQTADHAAEIARTIKDSGGDAIIAPGDTAKEKDIEKIIRRTLDTFGRIDYLILNAGANWVARDISEIPYRDWKNTLAAEIDGIFLMFRRVFPIMRRQEYGRVVILGLSGAMELQDMKDMAPDYCLGRAVRAWMTSAWAAREYDHHICINIIEPGNVPGLSFNEAVSLVKEERNGIFPGARRLTGHEIARTIVFLCSEAGRYISGSTIRIPTPILPVD